MAPSTASAERVVYINLDATNLVDTAGQDPTQNSYSTAGFTAGTISGWPGLSESDRAELLYWLMEATVPFDITFTFDRPAAGTYDMLVTGTDTDIANLFPDVGCSSSIGLADCDDENVENISFLFYGCLTPAQQSDMRRVAFSSLISLGFGWGLENLTGSGQVMASYSVFGLQFGDMCTDIAGASQCDHVGCGAAQQNSTTDLTGRLGARVDDGPPVLTILSPESESVVDGGTEVVVEAELADKYGGLSASLEIVEAKILQEKEEPPFVWQIQLPPGEAIYTLRVTGVDADANMVSEDLLVCVDMPDCSGSGSTDTGGGSSTGDDPTTGDPSGGDTTTSGAPSGSEETGDDPMGTGAIDPTAPIEPFDLGPASSGCHCRGGSEPGAAALMLLGLLGLSRRRRG